MHRTSTVRCLSPPAPCLRLAVACPPRGSPRSTGSTDSPRCLRVGTTRPRSTRRAGRRARFGSSLPRRTSGASCSRCRRQALRCELYRPSRRTMAPACPGLRSISSRIFNLCEALKRLRFAFSTTSGSTTSFRKSRSVSAAAGMATRQRERFRRRRVWLSPLSFLRTLFVASLREFRRRSPRALSYVT